MTALPDGVNIAPYLTAAGCLMPDAYQKYLSKYAASHQIGTNELCGRDEVVLTFFDADGEHIGGYYIRPDQVNYAVECIIRK